MDGDTSVLVKSRENISTSDKTNGRTHPGLPWPRPTHDLTSNDAPALSCGSEWNHRLLKMPVCYFLQALYALSLAS